MFYPQELIEQIRYENDLVEVIGEYIKLDKKGNSYFGLCPFHNEKTPSFSVSQDKQLYHCFGCGASGNVYSFIMERENYDFKTAVEFLANRVNIDLPEVGDTKASAKNTAIRNAVLDIHKISARFYYDILQSSEGEIGRNYLNNRQLSKRTQIKYGLGFSPNSWDGLYNHLKSQNFDNNILVESGLIMKGKEGNFYDRFRNRLMFPIFDIMGRVIGFGGRSIDDTMPKYINSPETRIFEKSKNLYSLNFSRANKHFILVEGYMDVLSLYENGIENSIATLGTAFNENHAKTLRKYAESVSVLFDSDEAGEKASIKALPIIMENGIKANVVKLKGAKDPDDYIRDFGVNAFRNQLANPLSHIAFNISVLEKEYDLENNEEKIEFTKEVAKLLSTLESPVERDVYINEASEVTGISRNAIIEEINKYTKDRLKNVNTQIKTDLKYKRKDNSHNKSLNDAKKTIVYLAANDKNHYSIIKDNISYDEMEMDIYGMIFRKISDLYKDNKEINPADLVSYFEESKDQKLVSEIFTTAISQDEIIKRELGLSQNIKLIKTHYIDEQMKDEEDIGKIQELIEQKREVDKLKISLT